MAPHPASPVGKRYQGAGEIGEILRKPEPLQFKGLGYA
jgi:hypothetical protein